jgi:hypothetical protein
MSSSSARLLAVLVSLLTFLFVAHAARATGATAPVTRDYEVGDLIGADSADDPKVVEDAAASLAKWIASLTRGNESAIDVAAKDDTFAITATTDQHDRIHRLIEQIRERNNTRISVETRLVWLNKEIEEETVELADTLEQARVPGRQQNGIAIDDATVEALMRLNHEAQLTAPRVTISNGQRAHVLAASQRELITGYTRNEADPQKWEPKVEALQTGLLLDVRARAAEPDQNLALAIKVENTTLLSVRDEPFKEAPAEQKLTVQVPTTDVRKLDALVSAPSGQTMLFHIPSDEPLLGEDARLYVLVRAIANR